VATHQRANETKFDAEVPGSYSRTFGQFINTF